jgi:hypothetical protein
MRLTERELALIMLALDHTANSIQEELDTGGGNGYDDGYPDEMQRLWDRVAEQREYQTSPETTESFDRIIELV